jgi:hypothetical protein
VRIQTEPTGATIVVQGEVIGTSPMDFQAQPARPLRMGILLRGHDPLLFPSTLEDFPQLLADGSGPPIVLSRTTATFGLVEVSVAAVGSAHVIVDGIDAGEEPVLVPVRFAAGAPQTRVEVEIPGRGRRAVPLQSVAVPWALATVDASAEVGP